MERGVSHGVRLVDYYVGVRKPAKGKHYHCHNIWCTLSSEMYDVPMFMGVRGNRCAGE